jgi:uncharacterized protein YbcI
LVIELADMAENLRVPPRRPLFVRRFARRPHCTQKDFMEKSTSLMARQIAQAASASEQRRTGLAPQAVSVVLSAETLVITLHGALSLAEKALAKTAVGAAQLQDYHRQLFASSSETLRDEIKRITGVEVREATAEVEPATGAVVQVFTTGTMVQVFLLAHNISPENWNAGGESS